MERHDIRWPVTPAARSDLAQIARIDAEALPPGWSERQFREILALDGSYAFVVRGGDILGYLLYRRVLDEVEVVRIATDPRFRQRGIGAAMLLALFDHCAPFVPLTIYLEVRRSNGAAIALYEKMGFLLHDIRKGYYGGEEDALIFRRLLDASGEGNGRNEGREEAREGPPTESDRKRPSQI